MRLILLLATVVSLALTGCIGGEDTPVETASNNVNAQAAANSAATLNSNASEMPDEVAEPVVVPIEYSGAFSNSVTVCQRSPGSMMCNAFGGNPSDSLEPSFTGIVKSGEVTMTWTPANPKMERLIMHVYACNEDGCDATVVKGASPLTATFMGVKAESLFIAFMTEPAEAGDVSVYAVTDQSFEVTGSIVAWPN